MTPSELKTYLTTKMRMSHVYQPVMIRRLLLNGGAADTQAIAKDLVQHDESQIEYYMLRVDQMVGVVLRKNKVVTKDKKSYHLPDFESYTPEEQAEIIAICEQRIEEYMTKRGMDIWDHRRRNRKPIDGSIRYQVLERAHNRCELCGISSEVRALEVDHIVRKTGAVKTLFTTTKRSATNATPPNATPTTLILEAVLPYSIKRKNIACSVASTGASSEKTTWPLPFMISTPLRKGTRSSSPSGISNRTSTLHKPN